MGYLKALGDFAKGFAQGYVSERGLEGTIEDVAGLAQKAKKMFDGNQNQVTQTVSHVRSINPDSSDETDFQDRWNNLIDSLRESMDDGKFCIAAQQLATYYRQYEDEKDYYFYRLNVSIYVRWLEYGADDENQEASLQQKAKSYLKEAKRLAHGDEECLESVQKMQDRLDTHIENKKYLDKWFSFTDGFNKILDEGKYDLALSELDYYYENNEDHKDFWYYRFQARIYGRLFSNKIYDWDNPIFDQDSYRLVTESIRMAKNLATSEEEKREVEGVQSCLDDAVLFYNRCKDYLKDKKAFEPQLETLIKNQMYRDAFEKIKEFHIKHYENDYESDFGERLCQLYGSLAEESSLEKEIEQEIAQVMHELSISDSEYAADNLSSLQEEFDHAKAEHQANVSKHKVASSKPECVASEQEYVQEFKACMSNGGSISDTERRLLNRLAKSLNITPERVKELEDSCQGYSLSDEEKEYCEEYKACLNDDGVISDNERRLLNRLLKTLNITEQRAAELEATIK